MALVDQLGPETKRLVNYCAVQSITVGAMLSAMPVNCYDDDPSAFDRKLAQWLRRQIEGKFGAPAESFNVQRRGAGNG